MRPAPGRISSVITLAFLTGLSGAQGQVVQPAQKAAARARPDQVVLAALRNHPVTAPYPIVATWQKGKVILSGRVGTGQVHDAAVRLAIDIGYPFRDDLVIDTGMAHAVAQSAGSAMAGGGGGLGSTPASPYVYPPPLFGRLDDPFFGFVPPLVSFPPWWRRGDQAAAMGQSRRMPDAAAPPAAPTGGWQALEVDPVIGQVDVSVDIAGQVFLRGSVVSDQAAREIEDSVRRVPGVTNVVNDLQVVPRRDPAADQPPPPPVPMIDREGPSSPPAPAPTILPARKRPLGTAPTPVALDSQALSSRIVGSLERRPPTAGLPVQVRAVDGVVTLSGRVPSTYEAMLVYRTAQQTPGAREIIDRLEFTVPDEDHANPLLQQGRPEDIEPYLTAQIRRHVGDLAHIDHIAARGNVLELRGSIDKAGDQERLLAILRSIPVLYGFKLETQFAGQ